jgi:hypothetical protein
MVRKGAWVHDGDVVEIFLPGDPNEFMVVALVWE